jgi:hypothetical protein
LLQGQTQKAPAICGRLDVCPDMVGGARACCRAGEGKTRVILPMLALHWAKGQHLVGVVCSAICDHLLGS